MDPLVVGLLCIALMFAFMAFKMPICITLFLAGIIGAWWMGGKPALFTILSLLPYREVVNYTFSCVPMFVFMGVIVHHSGVSRDAFEGFKAWLGHLKGGVALATIGTCGVFAAASGSSIAGAATMGSVALPEMRRMGYSQRLACGSIAAGGTLANMIPPSTGMIIFGLMADVSIGRLFMAGLFPGIILTLLFMLTIYVWVSLRPGIGPPTASFPWRERLVRLPSLLPFLALFVFVIGGIFFGVFTPTEAGGMGAFGAIVISLVMRRLSLRALIISLKDAVRITCMLMAIITGALTLNFLLATTGIAAGLASLAIEAPLPSLGVVFLIMLVYMFLGAVMDALAMQVITIPIFAPIILALGYDLIWFGVLVELMVEMAMITPPIGLCVYTLKSVAREVPIVEIFRGIMPFLIPLWVIIFMVMFWPNLALWLPTLMKG